ncbi:MAG: D-alanine--D-alanine ligase [Pseudomonadota bacterium]
MSRTVAVLMGGWSVEREVSLVSGKDCAKALEERGFDVNVIDVDRDLAAVLERDRPDVVFNALHGRFGEDGRIQGLLDIMQIPYTHSGMLASALAMDKPLAKQLFEAVGLRCPQGVMMAAGEVAKTPPFGVPCVVKPKDEGSSVGVIIVKEHGDLAQLERANIEVLVEPFLGDTELTCAVLEDEALAVTEIRPRCGFYDYRAKYTEGVADHLVPAPLAPEVTDAVMDASLRAHRALDCRGVSRADFRLDKARGVDGLYLLEVNTQPGMTPLSLVPEQAAYRGINFGELVERLVEAARCDS